MPFKKKTNKDKKSKQKQKTFQPKNGVFIRTNTRGNQVEIIQEPASEVEAWTNIRNQASDDFEKEVIDDLRKLGLPASQYAESWQYIQTEIKAGCYPVCWVFSQRWASPTDYHLACYLITKKEYTEEEIQALGEQAAFHWVSTTPGAKQEDAPGIQITIKQIN